MSQLVDRDFFRRWHAENPGLWRSFQAVTRENIARGETRLSALWVLYEVRLRWDGQRFPNALAPYYARLWAEERMPGEPMVFDLRPSAADRPPSKQMDLPL